MKVDSSFLGDMSTVTTLVFDVDDTLYDVASGFTAHRNGDAVHQFMIERLRFPSVEAAAAVRDEYFEKYHSTVKALTIAEAEGVLPEGVHFEATQLAEWWAMRLDFARYLVPNVKLIDSLRRSPLRLVAFTNAPKRYAIAVLEALQLREFFPDERLFGVEDVMALTPPCCKPEPAAFSHVLAASGCTAAEAVMIEDSMKNVRAAKAIGMRTVLVRGLASGDSASKAASEATKPGDAPNEADAAVDAAVAEVSELEVVLPGLWQTPAVFAVSPPR